MDQRVEEALRALEDSLRLHLDHYTSNEIALIHRAMHTAVTWQGTRTRLSGTPAWAHTLAVGNDLIALGADADPIVAGYHHDDLEDLGKTAEDLCTLYGPEAAGLVVALTKTVEDTYIAQLIREGHVNWWVLLIKAVDRRHNIRTVAGFKLNKQEEYAHETRALVAVLRIGSIWVPAEWQERYHGILDESQGLARQVLASIEAGRRTNPTLPLLF
ncbi:MAG: HD domain-containing protein [Candidatus Berkelbacteria bacterium]|nr:HD domain-containing protein [Candidatus Berkelbacteria bacterium]